MKVAIIGGGPAAFGALAQLIERKKAGEALEIEVFSSGDENQEAHIAAAYKERYSPHDINAILQAGKAQGGGGALPPRSFNGQALQSHVGENAPPQGCACAPLAPRSSPPRRRIETCGSLT